VFPIDKTVADINLEQVGRTDSSEGPQIANASLTGFDYSDVGTILEAAGKLTGIKVYKHEQNSDAFFDRSDNQALADQGVPAHTLCTAFVYPDYHGVAITGKDRLCQHGKGRSYGRTRACHELRTTLRRRSGTKRIPKWRAT